eukprot:Plantae.Rhodophyta-Hildenbrandia_rubra.ctg16262.p1 GENE.Plantae.Rhodophyta-Hildenbrandia_rubra.ctg16262~~Plantae.Rhodophyta-Hildenbrandia_rubra.ctg16262.p1  ORF type:complete len:206 (+),score=46.27 Plantae.Rhodophyta-Hildenbrandia_rubra.ctg16262:418-1035(+)
MGQVLGSAMGPSENPILFIKPSTSYLREGSPILLPPGARVEHEVELGVVIGKRGKNVSVEKAWDYIFGYFCGIDLTARNWQKDAKDYGRPWEISKGLDGFMVIGDVLERELIEGEGGGRDRVKKDLWLSVNGVMRQKESTEVMIWPVDQILSFVSRRFTLEEGDLVITGTPKGVGVLKPGDRVKAGIADVTSMEFDCELNKDWID